MKFAIVLFPGSNRDHDAYHVVKHILGEQAEIVWHKATDLNGADAVVLPGGFSHGDYLRTGAIARFSPVMAAVKEFADRGGPVLGICNGFQILLEAGLISGALIRNRGLKFRCEFVTMRVERTDTPFTALCRPGQLLRVPIAHGEGNYFADPEVLARLEERGHVIFRYTDERGEPTAAANPNGSLNNIAGICNEARNVVGLMPHPEDAAERIVGSEDGLIIFRSAVETIRRRRGDPIRIVEAAGLGSPGGS